MQARKGGFAFYIRLHGGIRRSKWVWGRGDRYREGYEDDDDDVEKTENTRLNSNLSNGRTELSLRSGCTAPHDILDGRSFSVFICLNSFLFDEGSAAATSSAKCRPVHVASTHSSMDNKHHMFKTQFRGLVSHGVTNLILAL